jgi:hypothetical protein
MTVETRTLIELKDIVGIEFGCHNCGTKTLYAIEKAFQRLAAVCPNCNEDWFAPLSPVAHPSTLPTAKQVLTDFAAFQQLVNRKDIHAIVKIQIAYNAQKA